MSNEINKINDEEIEERNIDFNEFQVVRKEFFSHTYDYSISVRPDHIRFSASIVKRLEDIFYVQLLLDPVKKTMIIRPCGPDDKDCVQWGYVRAKNNKKAARDIKCKLFCMMLYKLLNWNTDYRYKILGTLIKSNGEFVILFNLQEQEAFSLQQRGNKSYLPEEWRDSFGLPFDEHEKNLKVTVLDGFARMEIIQKRNRPIKKAAEVAIEKQEALAVDVGGNNDEAKS